MMLELLGGHETIQGESRTARESSSGSSLEALQHVRDRRGRGAWEGAVTLSDMLKPREACVKEEEITRLQMPCKVRLSQA